MKEPELRLGIEADRRDPKRSVIVIQFPKPCTGVALSADDAQKMAEVMLELVAQLRAMK